VATRPDDSQDTICLLDDEPSVLKATGRLLMAEDWNVKPFTNPQAFLDYAQVHQPRVAVIDFRMPTMNGLEVQTRLSKVSPLTRVIVLTGDESSSVRSNALRAGASAFFLKPVHEEEFLAAVELAFQERLNSRST
jgi:two-component system response regulator HydG